MTSVFVVPGKEIAGIKIDLKGQKVSFIQFYLEYAFKSEIMSIKCQDMSFL